MAPAKLRTRRLPWGFKVKNPSRQVSKGKKREIWVPQPTSNPELELKPEPEVKKQLARIIFLERDASKKVEFYASNFFFHNGFLMINFRKPPIARGYNNLPRISMPIWVYNSLRAHWLESIGYCFVPLNLIEIIRNFRLLLPADHEYLKDFDLLTSRVHPSQNLYCVMKTLILARSKEIGIMNYRKDYGWVVDEKLSFLFNRARVNCVDTCHAQKRILRNFCEGAGPSDWSVYASRLLRMDIENHMKYRPHQYIQIDPCWQYLFEYSGGSWVLKIDIARTNGNSALKRNRIDSFLRDPVKNVEQPVLQNLQNSSLDHGGNQETEQSGTFRNTRRRFNHVQDVMSRRFGRENDSGSIIHTKPNFKHKVQNAIKRRFGSGNESTLLTSGKGMNASGSGLVRDGGEVGRMHIDSISSDKRTDSGKAGLLVL